jgi:hypothetical protein
MHLLCRAESLCGYRPQWQTIRQCQTAAARYLMALLPSMHTANVLMHAVRRPDALRVPF